ncbi:MAG TPA: LptF/LptG family permease [Chitinophagaceae bacterium]|nr:LptF/LptG family permease [Chitinophagaceae bacterium]
MIKKLDILIVKAFIGPFIATFFITLLVLVMQFFWLWIDDFVGKGLSTGIILEFTWYQTAALVPLALPLAVLLSSLMTFGNLGESFELVAIKSAGISLLRFMRPLFIVSLFLCFLAFLFANYVMPVAVLKSRTLLGDIYIKKPAFELKEGVFYNKIEGFAIKVGKKENDSILHDVIIYEKGGIQDNFIVATSGVMRITDNRRFLEMKLKDGWRYEEKGNGYSNSNSDFIRMGFKEYTKQFDLSSLQFTRTSDTMNQGNHQMRNMKQLDRAIDSLKKEVTVLKKRTKKEALSYFSFAAYLDSGWKKPDTFKFKQVKKFDELIPDSLRNAVNEKASNQAISSKSVNDVLVAEYKGKKKDLRLHQIEWHRKIALSAACLVLFLIGAPLGSIIRKGGLGSPLIFAIIFFMVFYFLSNTGQKFAKEGAMSPFMGMWLSTFILVPIGVFLTYKALKDSQLLNKEFYFRLRENLRKKFKKTKTP